MRHYIISVLAALLLATSAAAAPADSAMALLDAGWNPDYTETALRKRGESFDLLAGGLLADTLYPLGSHPVLVVGEWWTDSTAASLNNARERIRNYVSAGGILVVFYSLHTPCDTRFWTSSWSPVPVYVRLNNAGDDCRQAVPRFKDVIENTDHPLFGGIAGMYLDVEGSKSFSSADPYWYVLAKNREHGKPTVMERRHDKGTYLLVGPAVSYHYGDRHAATYLFDNIMTYAGSLADQVRQERIAERKREIADSLAAVLAERERAVAESLAVVESVAAESVAAAIVVEPPADESGVQDAGSATEYEVEPVEPEAESVYEPAPDTVASLDVLPAPPASELLPLGGGNNWEFSNEQIWSITGTKSILSKDVAVLNFSAGMGVYFIGAGDEGILLYGTSEGGVDNIHSSPQVLFRYPAAEGDTYQSDIAIGGVNATVTVGGTNRQIETDMGVFSCYEYIVEMDTGVQYWYLCPEIGFVRYMSGDENMVLVDYNVE